MIHYAYLCQAGHLSHLSCDKDTNIACVICYAPIAWVGSPEKLSLLDTQEDNFSQSEIENGSMARYHKASRFVIPDDDESPLQTSASKSE